MAYTDKNTISNYLNITIDSSMDSQITAWIAAIQAWIDKYTGTSFESSSDTYRLYDGSGTDTLMTDDFQKDTLTKIELLDLDGDVDETNDDTDEWWTYPENIGYRNKIVLNADNASFTVFTKGHQNIKVYATFSQSATVPADIKHAATMLTAGIIQKSMSGEGVKSERLGAYEITFKDIEDLPNFLDTKEILDQYRYIPIV